MDTKNTTTVSDSYIRDVTFPSGYNANQNPLKIHYVCVLSGLEKGSLPEKFTYCDLGCGNGVTLNLLASMFPAAEFTGIDFNQDHIKQASKNARAYGIKNVNYIQEDFAKIEKLKFKKQDFICCNGTFSWVNTHIQEIIKKFVGKTLAANGKFYVEYAAQPGKIQMDPLWHFLREMTIDSSEDSVERVKLGIKYLEKLIKNNALFFKQNPVALARVKTLTRENTASIAHNALTEWQALNHSDIARNLQAYDITFAGQADLIQNHEELHIPKIFYEDIKSLPTSIMRETLKDYILNRGLRRDIYIKNAGETNNDLARFDDLKFGISINSLQPLRKVDFGNGQSVDFNEKIYRDIVDCISENPVKISNLESNNVLATYGAEKIIHALQLLTATGYLVLYKESANYETEAIRDKIKLSSRFTELELKNIPEQASLLLLPSEVTGHVEHLGPVLALFLKSMVSGKNNDPVDSVCAFLDKKGYPILIQNKKITSKKDLKNSLDNLYKIFSENILPMLARLNIVH